MNFLSRTRFSSLYFKTLLFNFDYSLFLLESSTCWGTTAHSWRFSRWTLLRQKMSESTWTRILIDSKFVLKLERRTVGQNEGRRPVRTTKSSQEWIHCLIFSETKIQRCTMSRERECTRWMRSRQGVYLREWPIKKRFTGHCALSRFLHSAGGTALVGGTKKQRYSAAVRTRVEWALALLFYFSIFNIDGCPPSESDGVTAARNWGWKGGTPQAIGWTHFSLIKWFGRFISSRWRSLFMDETIESFVHSKYKKKLCLNALA